MISTEEHLTVLPLDVSPAHAVCILIQICMEVGPAEPTAIRASGLLSSFLSLPLCCLVFQALGTLSIWV